MQMSSIDLRYLYVRFGVVGLGWYPCCRLKHIETRTHNQCGDTIEKSQAPDDGCINVRNMLSIEEVK